MKDFSRRMNCVFAQLAAQITNVAKSSRLHNLSTYIIFIIQTGGIFVPVGPLACLSSEYKISTLKPVA